MKKQLRWLAALFCLALLLAACGPQEPLIEVDASEVNLTATDLGEEFAQGQSVDYEQMVEWFQLPETSTASDASMRIFSELDGSVQVVSVVMVYNAGTAARGALRDAKSNLEQALQQVADDPTLSWDQEEEPELADEALWAQSEALEDGGQVYLLGFRKQNVTVLLVVRSMEEQVDEDWIYDLAEEMLSRIPDAPEE